MNLSNYCFVVGFILLVGLAAPSKLSFAEKNFTKLDKLALYIQKNSNNNELVSYHIASALISSGGDVKTLTAIAEVESNFNPSARGDSGDSVGMFQIQPKHWGYVPKNVYAQTSKAKDILKAVKKISCYNGSGYKAKQYAKQVNLKRKEINAYYI